MSYHMTHSEMSVGVRQKLLNMKCDKKIVPRHFMSNNAFIWSFLSSKQSCSLHLFSQEKCHPAPDCPAQHKCCNTFPPLKVIARFFDCIMDFFIQTSRQDELHQIGISTNPLFRPPAWLNSSGDYNLLALSLSRSFLEKLNISRIFRRHGIEHPSSAVFNKSC